MRGCERWSLCKTDASAISCLKENFPHEGLLSEKRLMRGIIAERLFKYAQRDIEVPQHVCRHLSNFPLVFKNTVVNNEDIGTLVKEDAEKQNIALQPRRMLESSFH